MLHPITHPLPGLFNVKRVPERNGTELALVRETRKQSQISAPMLGGENGQSGATADSQGK